MKAKKYNLQMSKIFPKTHPRKGERTFFEESVANGSKKHTIRGHYEHWKRAIDECKTGNSIIQLKQWKETPYRSKQQLIGLINQDGFSSVEVGKQTFIGVDYGVQKIHHSSGEFFTDGGTYIPRETLANNDGLSLEDFDSWFLPSLKKGINEFVIIHFTKNTY